MASPYILHGSDAWTLTGNNERRIQVEYGLAMHRGRNVDGRAELKIEVYVLNV